MPLVLHNCELNNSFKYFLWYFHFLYSSFFNMINDSLKYIVNTVCILSIYTLEFYNLALTHMVLSIAYSILIYCNIFLNDIPFVLDVTSL